MFRPAPMMQFSALVLEREERTILGELGRLGVLHLTRNRAVSDTAQLAGRDHGAELARWHEVDARVSELQQVLDILPGTETPKPAATSLTQTEERLRAMAGVADGILRRRQGLLQKLSESTALGERLLAYRGLDMPLDPTGRFSFLHFVSGSLPVARLATLQQEVGVNVALLPLAEQQGRQPLIAMTIRQGQAALDSALREAGFQADTLPVVPGATADTLAESNQRAHAAWSVELAAVQAELQACAVAFAPELAALAQRAQLERCLLEADQHFLRTAVAVLISGWVPTDAASTLERRLRQITGGRCVITLAAAPKLAPETIPVLLRHPWWLRPFAALVRAYGLPNYAELEPTLFVALSYLLMFGVMFGDVGHGAVLALGGLIALRTGRTGMARDLGWLVLFAGISASGFGWVYGSCFGLERFKPYALWRDPLEGDPLALITTTLGIGVIMISLGLVLNIINCFRRGEVIAGILDKFGLVGGLFYWGALALILNRTAIEAHGLVNLAMMLLLGLPLVGWVLRGPLEFFLGRSASPRVAHHGSLMVAFAESLVGAFEAVLSYLANTISFVRLAAYAMSHAALLVAVFAMASALKGFSPGGDVLGVLVILLGNLGVLVLEAVIASVQALRLEYYEFFSKFYSGNGLAFAPFRLPGYEPVPAGLDFGVVGGNKLAAGPAA